MPAYISNTPHTIPTGYKITVKCQQKDKRIIAVSTNQVPSNNNLLSTTTVSNTTPPESMASTKQSDPFINMKILHKGDNVDGDNYQLLTITEEGKANGYYQCVNNDGETIKTRLNCTTKIVISDDVEKNKSILTYQKDKIYSKREGADKKQILWDGFQNSFVEFKNGKYYKVKFTEACDGYITESTEELLGLDGYENTEDDESVEKMAAAVSSAEQEPPAGLDLLADAVESREKSGDEMKDGYEGDSDATIAIVSSTSETEEEKAAAAGLDALLSGKNGNNGRRRKREEDESVIAAKTKDDKAESILSESTKQDVNAYIETIKQERSDLFEKATADMKDDRLHDKKSSLEEECSSLKVDLLQVTNDDVKEFCKSKLLESQTELTKVETLMDAEEEENQKLKEYIQATILKELGGNKADEVASRPLKKRRVEGEKDDDEVSFDESTKQDVNAYIETTKKGRSALIDKATADIKDDRLHDKKSSLEKEYSSFKNDESQATNPRVKEFCKMNLLENQKELDDVVAQLKTVANNIRGVQQAINAIIIKELERNEDAMH